LDNLISFEKLHLCAVLAALLCVSYLPTATFGYASKHCTT